MLRNNTDFAMQDAPECDLANGMLDQIWAGSRNYIAVRYAIFALKNVNGALYHLKKTLNSDEGYTDRLKASGNALVCMASAGLSSFAAYHVANNLAEGNGMDVTEAFADGLVVAEGMSEIMSYRR